MAKLVIGVDLGATKILYGIGSITGNLLYKNVIPTQAAKGSAYVIEAMTKAINSLLESYAAHNEIIGIAIAAPGPLSYPEGVVLNSPNLKWDRVALKEEMEKRLKRPVIVEKDTNIAALGEYYFGQNKKSKELIYITISTGIGGGLIIDGELYRGSRGGAGEIGHMAVAPGEARCACGRQGCLEALASGTAIADKAKALNIISENLGAKEVGDKARQGDKAAQKVIYDAADYLAIGITNLVNIFNPQKVVLGGGVMQGLQDLWLARISKQVFSAAFPLNAADLRIEVTSLQEAIGLYGCIAAAINMEQEF